MEEIPSTDLCAYYHFFDICLVCLYALTYFSLYPMTRASWVTICLNYKRSISISDIIKEGGVGRLGIPLAAAEMEVELKDELLPLSDVPIPACFYEENNNVSSAPEPHFNDSIAQMEQLAGRRGSYDAGHDRANLFHPTPSALHRVDTAVDSALDPDGMDENASMCSRLSYSRRRRRRDQPGSATSAGDERQRQELEKALKNLEEMQRENKERMRIGLTFNAAHGENPAGDKLIGEDQTSEQYCRTQSMGIHVTGESIKLQQFERAMTSLTVPDPLWEAINTSRRYRSKGSSNVAGAATGKRNLSWIAPSNNKREDTRAQPSRHASAQVTSASPAAESLSIKRDVNACNNSPVPANRLSTSKDINVERASNGGRFSTVTTDVDAETKNDTEELSGGSGTSSKTDPPDEFLYSARERRATKRPPNTNKRVAATGKSSSGRPSGRSTSPPIIILTVDTRRNLGEEDARRLLSAKPLEGYDSHPHLRASVDNVAAQSVASRRSRVQSFKSAEPLVETAPALATEGISASREGDVLLDSWKSQHTSDTKSTSPGAPPPTSSSVTDAATAREEGSQKANSGNGASAGPATPGASKAQTTITSPPEKKKKVLQNGANSRVQPPVKTRTTKGSNLTLKSPNSSVSDVKPKQARASQPVPTATPKVEKRCVPVHRCSFPRTSNEQSAHPRPTPSVVSNANQNATASQSEASALAHDKDGRRVSKIGVQKAAQMSAAAASQTSIKHRLALGRLPIRRKSLTSLSPAASAECDVTRPLATDRPVTSTSNAVRCIVPAQALPVKQLVPFCTECGRKHLDDKVKFCAFCGHKREMA
uniref:Uncharacterized protein TCIL3000_11_16390 n=1 Tax=Trypanosoma congolense (strain IL3000) TaxID=1068625 RepID=G0V3A4_TRYCI|nr:unnamed protein product [Trypanosoma congolense IL3000]